MSDFLVQDFGSKILWAFGFLVQGVFFGLKFLCPRFLGPRFSGS